ncbi:MAG: sulfatase [Akkermansiaceae bacterium]|nr:sulfatase [Akkermansiaceae bacterium]
MTAPFWQVLAGTCLFLAYHYGLSLWKLTQSSGEMANKFSALAREKHLAFLVLQNFWMLLAYGLLALAGAVLLQPLVHFWTARSPRKAWPWVMGRALLGAILLHVFFTLRLMHSRPYFINEAEFGHWYYAAFHFIPESIQSPVFFLLFTALPWLAVIAVLVWNAKRSGRRGWIALGATAVLALALLLWSQFNAIRPSEHAADHDRPNILIIGSDSLRADRLGYAGHRPARLNGPLAEAGVSPAIDALAARSHRFSRCYTPIGSTLESGISLMSSQYPHTHGVRQMYPDRETLNSTLERITPLPELLREQGYDTAAIGDWCAGYYELTPMGMEHVSVSSFDNFKIYMSQAVVMSHFVIPLYFDNALGHRLYPQLQSFAQFVTPKVVNKRVDSRLRQVAKSGQPFFWHVFFSCNHLPYRSPEPYNSMFADPDYKGPNRTGVDFDIDNFIGGTDLESKWKALPPAEAEQIRALYDGCTRYFDDCVGQILDSLERSGLADNTIVIITADHGDDLYEPGVTLGHGLTFNGGLYAYHVPLVIHVPGNDPADHPQTVRTIDIAPTIAELAGIDRPANWEGRSLAPWLSGKQPPQDLPVFAETGFPFIQFSVDGVERPHLPPMDEATMIDEDFNYQFVVKPEFRQRIVDAKQRCLVTRNWKLVCTPTAEGERHFDLYHLASDPDGVTEVSARHPAVLQAMSRALTRWMDQKIETPIADIFPDGEP